jgi:hypothetical protein
MCWNCAENSANDEDDVGHDDRWTATKQLEGWEHEERAEEAASRI